MNLANKIEEINLHCMHTLDIKLKIMEINEQYTSMKMVLMYYFIDLNCMPILYIC